MEDKLLTASVAKNLLVIFREAACYCEQVRRRARRRDVIYCDHELHYHALDDLDAQHEILLQVSDQASVAPAVLYSALKKIRSSIDQFQNYESLWFCQGRPEALEELKRPPVPTPEDHFETARILVAFWSGKWLPKHDFSKQILPPLRPFIYPPAIAATTKNGGNR
jgi:hypothetical protein